MINTAHTARRLHLMPFEARRAADQWHSKQVDERPLSRYVRAGRRLWLRPWPMSQSEDRTLLRCWSGLVWYHTVPLAVELELSVWSSEQTEISLHPIRFGLHAPGSFYLIVREALNDVANGILTANTSSHTFPVPMISQLECRRQLATISS